MPKNHLLASLPSGLAAAVNDRLVSQPLTASQVLRQRGEEKPDIYFIEEGLVSLLSEDGERGVEICLVGREGMVGASASLGTSCSPSTAVARLEGSVLRLRRSDFEALLKESPEFRKRIMTYIDLRLRDAELAIVAAGRCTVEQRVARWLLLVHDRIDGDEFSLTHDCLARGLGVRRPGVTVAIHLLEGKHAIRARRGRILIRSRDELERIAGIAYRPQPAAGSPCVQKLAA